MCPDHQLISTYLDGEMPSPWKEKLEEHLTKCSACKAKFDNYTLLRRLYLEETNEKQQEIAAQSRVWRGLTSRRRVKPAAGLWQRRVSIPLPAAAAAAVIILLIAVIWIRGNQTTNNSIAASQPQAADLAGFSFAADDEIPVILPDTDFNSLLQFFYSDGTETTIIRLPESRNFYRTGEPGAIKAADYQRNHIPGR